MAVRAPASADGDDHDLTLKTRVGVRHDLAVNVRERKPERLGWIDDAREARGITRLRQAFGERLLGSNGGQRLVDVFHDCQRAVSARCQCQAERTRTGEMTQDECAVVERAGQGARVAVHAQDRRRHLSAGLPDDQLPGRFALRALPDLHVPQARHFGDLRIRGHDRRETRGLERIRRAPRAARILSLEASIGHGRLELTSVFVERKQQLAVVETPGRGRHFLVTVEKRARDRRTGAGDLEAERYVERAVTDRDGGIPQSGQ